MIRECHAKLNMTSHSTTLPIYDSIQVFAAFITFPDDGHSAGRLWQGCPNAAVPLRAHTVAFPLKSVGGRSWSCVSPARVVAPGSAGTDSEVRGSLGTIVRHGAVLMPLSRGVCACVMVYAVFNERGEGHGGSHGRNRDLCCPSLYGFFRLFLHPLSGYFLKCSQIVFKAAWMLFETFC